MDAPFNPRTRSKVTLKSNRVVTTSLSFNLLLQLLLSNVTLVFALIVGKEWLLDEHVAPLWLAVRVLGCGSMGALLWAITYGDLRELELSTLGRASFLVVVQQVAMYMVVQRMSAVRAIILLQASTFILDSLMNVSISRRFVISLTCLVLIFLSSSRLISEGITHILPAFIALAAHAICTKGLETTWKYMEPLMGRGFAYSAMTGCGFLISGILYGLGRGSGLIEETPILPLSAFFPIPFISFIVLFYSPQVNRVARSNASLSYTLSISLLSTTAFAVLFGCLAFRQPFSFMDVLVAALLLYGSAFDNAASPIPTTSVSRMASSYLKTILSNPESRKIFYFLILNLSYMGVQIVYGIITNSLGLISDAIHMAFDCMAIAMGLFASVAATWMPNEQYTYGYGRMETLSGFANGIFLLLISVFIVFEAIQRLIDPPEMSTNKLLLVSTLGLGVNLFGMFAMGGHHHHGGHSHSHGGGSHSSHSHSHAHTSPTCPEDDHTHFHSHGHSHSHSPPVSISPPPHTHGHDQNGSLSVSPPSSPSRGHRRTLSVAAPSVNGINGIGSHHPNSPHSPAYSPAYFPGSSPNFPPNHSPLSPRTPRSANHKHRRTASHLDVLEISRPQVGSLNELAAETPFTPITPGYEFGQDPHFAEHHHSHHVPNSHDHAHHPVVHEGHSHNMRGVFLHVMADTLGSVGVIISTLLIQWYGWTGFDPIASLFIAVLIAASVVPLVIDTGRVLALDASPREQDIKHALSELRIIEGVASYSQPRFWPKDASTLIGSIHIQLSAVSSAGSHSARGETYPNVDRVLERVDTLLRSTVKGLEELTIQIEKTRSE